MRILTQPDDGALGALQPVEAAELVPLAHFSRLESGFLPPEVRGFSPAGSGSSLMTGGVRFGKLKVVKAEDLSFRFGG